MTPLQLCEPLFQYICRINRAARKGAAMEASHVRAEIKGIFEDMAGRAVDTPGLREQFQALRLPLVFFCDYIIRTSAMSFAASWQNIAEEEAPPIYTGDEMFFLMLDQTLHDKSDAASARLAVYYTCMGLGFLGYYETDVQEVQRRVKEIASRLRSGPDADRADHICPEAYEHVNTADLTEPPSRSLVPMVVAMVCLLILLFVANVYLYSGAASELTDSIQSLVDRADGKDLPRSPQN